VMICDPSWLCDVTAGATPEQTAQSEEALELLSRLTAPEVRAQVSSVMGADLCGWSAGEEDAWAWAGAPDGRGVVGQAQGPPVAGSAALDGVQCRHPGRQRHGGEQR
jgi:hypothetical protein